MVEPFGTFAPDEDLKRQIARVRNIPMTWAGKRLAFFLRRRGMDKLTPPVDTVVIGLKLRLHPFDNLCEKRVLFTPDLFDKEERVFLAHEARAAKGGYNFVDIGANVGLYSLWVASQSAKVQALAFEPQQAVYDRLITNITLNQFEDRITPLKMAVSDQDGTLELAIDGKNKGASGKSANQVATEQVPMRPLLDVINDQGWDRIDALKIDIEGAEDIALAPFFETAPDHLLPKHIIMEWAPDRWDRDLGSLMDKAGYKIKADTRMNKIYERDAG